MGLRFCFGPSGSGKSHQIYQDIIKRSLEEPKRNFLVIVPDQFTLQTQKDLCLLHPSGGIMNIDVLSFGRLSHRIFEEVGRIAETILDDTGKNLILRKVAQEQKEQLKVLHSNLKRAGYIHEVKSAISEFMQYDIQPSDVERLITMAEQKGALAYKLEDLKVLYEAFLAFNKEKFVTTEETLTMLQNSLGRSKIINDSVVVFDGFTGFTPVQVNVIGELLRLTKEVIITFTIDNRVSPYELQGEQELFYLTQKSVASLEKISESYGVKRNREEDFFLNQESIYRFQQNQELAHLEKHIFRYQSETFHEEVERIKIYECKTLEEEINNVCICIHELIREKKYRYQDIAVVSGDLTSYSHYIQKIFSMYQIPYFMDSTKGILLNPFIEFIKSAFQIIISGYSYESIFHFLRSQMVDITQEDVDFLENTS